MTAAEATRDPVVLREKLALLDLMLAQNNLLATDQSLDFGKCSYEVREKLTLLLQDQTLPASARVTAARGSDAGAEQSRRQEIAFAVVAVISGVTAGAAIFAAAFAFAKLF
jgi:hypothetical protein